jgi:FtsP/CotA-like multicopper oxidase with cupredoxin domain
VSNVSLRFLVSLRWLTVVPIVVGLLQAIVLPSTATAQQEPSKNLLPQPKKIQAPSPDKRDAGVINANLYTVFGTYTIPGRFDSKGNPMQIWTRAYQAKQPESPKLTRMAIAGSLASANAEQPAVQPPKAGIPGPTFEFSPDDFLRIRLHNFLNVSDNPWLKDLQNNLDIQQKSSDELSDGAHGEVNIPHGFNEVNLHVHGLHVDPKQDNVAVLILPQDGDPSMLSPDQQLLVQNINHWWQRQYQYKIPVDHLPGTHWYHTHRHGASSIQVENGMAGALVIKPRKDENDIVPGLAGTERDRVLVVQEIQNFAIGGAGNGGGKGPGARRRNLQANPNVKPEGPKVVITTVNGSYAPTIKLPKGQIERWRFIVAGANHQQHSNIWMGKITFSAMDPALVKELKGIDETNYQDYIAPPAPNDGSSAPPPKKYFPSGITCSFDDPETSKFDGSVNMVAVDGITLSRAIPISINSPTFGSSGNRTDLLVQTSDTAKAGDFYFLFKNFPTQAPPVQGFALAYPIDSLFSDENAQWRYLALAQGKLNNDCPSLIVKSKPTLPKVSADPYNLGTDYLSFTVPWVEGVKADGTSAGDSSSSPVTPLIRGSLPKNSDDPISPAFSVPHAASPTDPNGILGNDQKWQPAGPAGGLKGSVTNDYLALVEIVDPEGIVPPQLTIDALNARLSRLSPTGDAQQTLLTVTNASGVSKPGIPAYVEPLGKRVDYRRAVVFDKAGTTFTYRNKMKGTDVPIQQFWIDGRQFKTSDYVGNPDATALIQTPLVNEVKHMGTFDPTNGSGARWTNQIHPLGTLGEIPVSDPSQQQILNTNPGYYRPIKWIAPAGEKAGHYNYDYSTGAIPDYKSVTGMPTSRPPQATSSEEWLLVNNSDIFHPFHIHISLFFVEEVGQLDYRDSKWGMRKILWDPDQKKVKWFPEDLPNENRTFGWVVGNWWDTIVIPPHGYVRFKTWINIPDQKPVERYAPKDPTDDREPLYWKVTDNANVYGSWVFHCHILRHEDRGMMSMVAVTPRPHSLGNPDGNPIYGVWNDGKEDLQVSDDSGAILVYKGPQFAEPYAYTGEFNEGLGDPFRSEPWLGSINFAPFETAKILPFCAAFQGPRQTPFLLVFADGSSWIRKGMTLPTRTAAGSLDAGSLDGTWTDDAGNDAILTTDTDAKLTIRPAPGTRVWWKSATGASTGGSTSYQYRCTFTNGAEVEQFTTCCATKDLNTIVFSNGIRWQRKGSESPGTPPSPPVPTRK